MGIGDFLWPFEKKFLEIPAAREATIACLVGGPSLGAVSIIATGTPKYAYKTSTYSGFVIFWLTFIYYRTQYVVMKAKQDNFVQAYKMGKIE